VKHTGDARGQCSGQRWGIFGCYTDGKASSAIELQAGGKEGWMGEIGYAAQLKPGTWSMILRFAG